MFCEKCGARLNEGAVFCPSCGNTVTSSPEMDIKALKCKMCGSPNMKKDGDFYVCDNCGTKYPASLIVKIEHSGSVTLRGDDFDTLLKNADTFYKIGDIDKARKLYERIINEYPDNYIAYERLIVLLTGNFAVEPDIDIAANKLKPELETITRLKKKLSLLEQDNRAFLDKVEKYLYIYNTLNKYKNDSEKLNDAINKRKDTEYKLNDSSESIIDLKDRKPISLLLYVVMLAVSIAVSVPCICVEFWGGAAAFLCVGTVYFIVGLSKHLSSKSRLSFSIYNKEKEIAQMKEYITILDKQIVELEENCEKFKAEYQRIT